MLKLAKNKSLLVIGLAAVFLFGMSSTSYAAGYAEPPSKLEEKLAGISAEEKEILQSLFTLAQEIELMEIEEKKLAQEIETANQDVKRTEAEISKEEANYKKQQQALKQVLRLYQKMGPGSYLEIVMDSDSLSTMLRRLTTLRDLTRNTGKLLQALKESKNKLAAEKLKLEEGLERIKQKQEQSKEALQNKLKLKQEKESYLMSLKEESKFYQEQLEGIQKMLDEIKPMLAEAAKEFSSIIKEGSLTTKSLNISISMFNIKGTLSEKTLNEIISKQPTLSKMVFAFHQDKIEISIPEKKLIIRGTFNLQEENVLRFQAEEGTFYDMPLESGYVQQLLSSGDLVLDLRPLLGRSVLKEIHIQEGYLEMFVKPNLF